MVAAGIASELVGLSHCLSLVSHLPRLSIREMAIFPCCLAKGMDVNRSQQCVTFVPNNSDS